jgi:3-deoxy-manno-octulosonate cytidylyltransferase (CMP-KDO synthetase)
VKVLAVIPARYSSTRFPGKVLAKDTGKYLIQHTYERACLAKLPEKVLIAADDQKVVEAAKTFGAECVLTSPDHQSGTDRIAEAVVKIADSGQRIADKDAKKKLNAIRYTLNANDIVVNLQGDEPEIDPGNIDYLAKLLIDHPNYPMATLAAEFQTSKQVTDPNIVKVIVSSCVVHDAYCEKEQMDSCFHSTVRRPVENDNTQYAIRDTHDEITRAIYFSRSPIPYDRDNSGVGNVQQYLRHIGIYAYRKSFLLEITALPQTPLEKIEKLEQLRAIENGYGILVGKVTHTCDGIDTPEQYAEFVKRYKK